MADDLQYREFFAELGAIVEASLVDKDIPVDVARHCAERVIDGVRREWGGSKPYVPQYRYTTESMRRMVIAQWDGNNTHALAQRLGVSDTRLRQLYDEGRCACMVAAAGGE